MSADPTVALVVTLVVALGWLVRAAARGLRGNGRARSGTPRPPGGDRSPSWAQSRRGRVGQQLRPTVEDVAPLLRFRTALERGASVPQAFEAMGAGADRRSEGARLVVARIDAGAGAQEAVDAWVDEGSDPAIRLLADALAISASTGGSQLRAVDAVIDAERDRASLRREVRALASQAQTSAVVLVALPIGFAAAIAAVDPQVRAFYLGSALGVGCMVAGCALDGAGAWFMYRLVRGVS